MYITDNIKETRGYIRNAKKADEKVGLVPTMGSLHEGHLSLIKAARHECDFTAVSIFVNPRQFVPGEDYEKYPRPVEEDIEKCRQEGVDLVFNPSVEEMYTEEVLTTVKVSKLTEPLCGAKRPGHFDGVTTVVSKLFNIIEPDAAYFGQKDAQQAIVVRKMIVDLNFPVDLRICPTVRDREGKALSSRNSYLDEEQAKRARGIYSALESGQTVIKGGDKESADVLGAVREAVERLKPEEVDYVELVDPYTLEKVPRVHGPVLLAVAVKIGPARLIDSILLDRDGNRITMDDLFVK